MTKQIKLLAPVAKETFAEIKACHALDYFRGRCDVPAFFQKVFSIDTYLCQICSCNERETFYICGCTQKRIEALNMYVSDGKYRHRI